MTLATILRMAEDSCFNGDTKKMDDIKKIRKEIRKKGLGQIQIPSQLYGHDWLLPITKKQVEAMDKKRN